MRMEQGKDGIAENSSLTKSGIAERLSADKIS